MKNIIVNELSSSLKSGDKSRIHTLRLIIAAIKDKEIASRSNGENEEISDEVVINLLKKMIKQRNDSIEMSEKAKRQELVEKEQGEIKIISTIDSFVPHRDDIFFIAIGDVIIREKIYKYLKEKQYKLGTLIHPTAYISKWSKIEAGSIICPFSTIGFNSANSLFNRVYFSISLTVSESTSKDSISLILF